MSYILSIIHNPKEKKSCSIRSKVTLAMLFNSTVRWQKKKFVALYNLIITMGMWTILKPPAVWKTHQIFRRQTLQEPLFTLKLVLKPSYVQYNKDLLQNFECKFFSITSTYRLLQFLSIIFYRRVILSSSLFEIGNHKIYK